jgi:chromosome partitioning protein
VALQRCFSAGTSVFEYDPSVDSAAVFLDVAETVETQLKPEEISA